jgi:hypothetical protein
MPPKFFTAGVANASFVPPDIRVLIRKNCGALFLQSLTLERTLRSTGIVCCLGMWQDCPQMSQGSECILRTEIMRPNSFRRSERISRNALVKSPWRCDGFSSGKSDCCEESRKTSPIESRPRLQYFFSIRIVDRLSAESCCGVNARIANTRMEFSDFVNSYWAFLANSRLNMGRARFSMAPR